MQGKTNTDLDLKTHANGHCISTVKLSVAHSWSGGDDFWFETYIFPSDGQKITGWSEEWGTRYRTEEEARAGHEHTVALVESGDLP